jgi:hypothetical protein
MYWHMGGTPMRLRNTASFKRSGSKRKALFALIVDRLER